MTSGAMIRGVSGLRRFRPDFLALVISWYDINTLRLRASGFENLTVKKITSQPWAVQRVASACCYRKIRSSEGSPAWGKSKCETSVWSLAVGKLSSQCENIFLFMLH
jgi:hypothetical protein